MYTQDDNDFYDLLNSYLEGKDSSLALRMTVGVLALTTDDDAADGGKMEVLTLKMNETVH